MSEGSTADPTLELLCPACGYDIRAGDGDACPECGEPIDRVKLALPSIPWVTAQTRWQSVTGFIKTVWLVTFHDRRLWREVTRPVDYAAARRFHAIAVVLSWIGLSLPIGVVLLRLEPRDLWRVFEVLGEAMPKQPIVWIALLAALPFLYVATGVHTYWLHPRGQTVVRQNRAVALGYYAAGPIAWWLVGGLVVLLGMWLERTGAWAASSGVRAVVFWWWLQPAGWWVVLGGVLLAVLGILGVFVASLRCTAWAAGREVLGVTSLGVAMPIVAVALLVGTVVLWPALYVMGWLVVYTLTT